MGRNIHVGYELQARTSGEIAKALAVTTDYLLGDDTQQDIIKDTTLLKHFKEVDNMPDDQKSALLKVIEAYVQNFRAKQAFAS